ncbi:helix-turn-helix domain-containing protein [Enterococcus alcedinis]|uniref:MerR family transcriptional regulator n=1 Tax=Enterococcus alcedinis TaxID=1274384 RepID=UPI00361F6E7D
MFSKMKIGDFAKYNQISIQALRYYEKIDLIHPIAIDPFTNYRFYHIKQSAVIDNIQFFQQLNFSLAEIKHMMDDTKNPTMLNQLIENKKEELRHELSQLDQQLKEIEAFQDGAFIYQAKKNATRLNSWNFQPAGFLRTRPPKIFMRCLKKNTNFHYVNLNPKGKTYANLTASAQLCHITLLLKKHSNQKNFSCFPIRKHPVQSPFEKAHMPPFIAIHFEKRLSNYHVLKRH